VNALPKSIPLEIVARMRSLLLALLPPDLGRVVHLGSRGARFRGCGKTRLVDLASTCSKKLGAETRQDASLDVVWRFSIPPNPCRNPEIEFFRRLFSVPLSASADSLNKNQLIVKTTPDATWTMTSPNVRISGFNRNPYLSAGKSSATARTLRLMSAKLRLNRSDADWGGRGA